jgi:hypothetical protein
MRELDRSQPCEQLYPAGRVAFIQNGVPFDAAGREVVDEPGPGASPAAPGGSADDKPQPAGHRAEGVIEDEYTAMPWTQLRKLAIDTLGPDAVNMKRPELEAALRSRAVGAAA